MAVGINTDSTVNIAATATNYDFPTAITTAGAYELVLGTKAEMADGDELEIWVGTKLRSADSVEWELLHVLGGTQDDNFRSGLIGCSYSIQFRVNQPAGTALGVTRYLVMEAT